MVLQRVLWITSAVFDQPQIKLTCAFLQHKLLSTYSNEIMSACFSTGK